MTPKLLSLLVGLLLLVAAAPAFGTGTVSVDRASVDYGKLRARRVEVVTISWTADASAATVPATTVPLTGFLLKVVTKPGGTAPTSGYGISVNDPLDSSHDALNGALASRSSSATETVQPYLTNVSSPIFLAGNYVVKWASNSVNSATGKIVLYLVD